ncbi:MAG: fructosamine kinase family protein [Chloroflexota bacterium]
MTAGERRPLTWRQRIEEALDTAVDSVEPLGGGCIGQVFHLELADGEERVAKVDEGPEPRLDVEGYMLQYLQQHSNLPVPQVYLAEPDLLVMEFLPGDSRFSAGAQEHAAELLAALHDVSSDRFGLERSTLIGGLHQPNPWYDTWITFFVEKRLLYMAREAEMSGRLPAAVRRRVERLVVNLHRWLHEPEAPSLIHGDVWTTNVLAQGGCITGFLDPAIYYAHPEIELAFITLFNTFGEPFFRRYRQLRPIEAGFFEERRDLYNLYPLLVHVRLFGGSYVQSVKGILGKFGF